MSNYAPAVRYLSSGLVGDQSPTSVKGCHVANFNWPQVRPILIGYSAVKMVSAYSHHIYMKSNCNSPYLVQCYITISFNLKPTIYTHTRT
jgi:hypothetical protein